MSDDDEWRRLLKYWSHPFEINVSKKIKCYLIRIRIFVNVKSLCVLVVLIIQTLPVCGNKVVLYTNFISEINIGLYLDLKLPSWDLELGIKQRIEL